MNIVEKKSIGVKRIAKPDIALKSMYEKIKGKWMGIILVVFLTGLLCNFGLLLKQVANPDDYPGGRILESWNRSVQIYQGRWASSYLYELRHNVYLPALLTVLSVALYAVSAVLVVRLLKIKSTSLACITGCLLVTFPSYAQYMTYFVMSDAFSVSITLSVLSFYILERGKNKKTALVVSAIMIGIATSIFQSVLGLAVSLCASRLIIEAMDARSKIKPLLQKTEIYLAYILSATAFYFISGKISCALAKIEMQADRKIDFTMFLHPAQLIAQIKKMYQSFFGFFLSDAFLPYSAWKSHILFIVVFVLAVLALFSLIVERICGQNERSVLLYLCVLVLLYPLFNTTIGLIGANLEFKTLPNMMVPIALALKIIEDSLYAKRFGTPIQWAVLIIAIIINANNIMISHTIVEALNWQYRATYSQSVRVLDAIEESKDYYSGARIAILGEENGELNAISSSYWPYAKTSVTSWGTVWSNESNYEQAFWAMFYRMFHGLVLNFASIEEVTEIVQSTEFSAMPAFPNKASIKTINGVIVVKLSEFSELTSQS